jgi:hypothetical protein
MVWFCLMASMSRTMSRVLRSGGLGGFVEGFLLGDGGVFFLGRGGPGGRVIGVAVGGAPLEGGHVTEAIQRDRFAVAVAGLELRQMGDGVIVGFGCRARRGSGAFGGSGLSGDRASARCSNIRAKMGEAAKSASGSMVSASGSVVVEGGGVEMSIVPGPWWVKMAADDTRTGGNVAIAEMTLVDSIDNMHGMDRVFVLDCERREALLSQHSDFERLQQAGHTCSTRDCQRGSPSLPPAEPKRQDYCGWVLLPLRGNTGPIAASQSKNFSADAGRRCTQNTPIIARRMICQGACRLCNNEAPRRITKTSWSVSISFGKLRLEFTAAPGGW